MLNMNEQPINNDPTERRDPEGESSPGSTNRGLWIAFALMVGVLLGAAAYGYRSLKNNGIELAQLPGMIQSMTGLNQRIASIEATMATWTSDKQALLDRLGHAERKMNSNLQKARQHADVVTSQLEERIVDQMDGRTAIVDARLDKIEVGQTAQHAQLARLQDELASARREIAALRQTTDGELAGLQQHVAGSDQQVEKVAQQLERRRVDFEAVRNTETEIVSGVALKVNDTDIRHQRFSGWIQILPEARFLWVSDQGIQQPVEFYRERDGSQYELVVTRVVPNSLVGYLLVPNAAGEDARSPRAQSGATALASTPSGQGGGI